MFYALHHLYLTRFAAYVVIFNMEVCHVCCMLQCRRCCVHVHMRGVRACTLASHAFICSHLSLGHSGVVAFDATITCMSCEKQWV